MRGCHYAVVVVEDLRIRARRVERVPKWSGRGERGLEQNNSNGRVSELVVVMKWVENSTIKTERGQEWTGSGGGS